MRVLIVHVPMTLCIALAGAIVFTRGPDAGGWGWFLFLAVLFAPTWHRKDGPSI